ncbi:MAG: sodium-dependent transporter [Alkaliphilus sp.]|nr:sodium-dependent transporter [bacterium AH-315-L21]MBN4062606.1 sodium-dependent transporter [Alkaliphilus sp. AH-315-G20]PHS35347.1 MAG: sodium-dependent transporter [Alkaliphilus sp.]
MSNLQEKKQREQWSSRLGFVLAAAGSAIGLGNLWRFPYMAGQNGGGAFVAVYLGLLVLVGFTIMLAELTLGRYTQLNAIGAYKKISEKWAWVGALGVLAGFMILSFYSVVGGWVINYVIKALTGAFNTADMDALGGMFGSMITNPFSPIFYHAIFMILTLGIVLGGIKGGIEKYSKILMPALFVMLFAIMLRSVTLPGAMEGVKYFLVPDWNAIDGGVILAALGQVFFSLSLGMGCMVTYGSYIKKDENLLKSALSVPLLDTGAALLAGLAILPAVFAFGFDPAEGPGLVFVTLPAVFSQMPLGGLFGVAFFLLVLFAALTSAISLLEVVVAYVIDEWKWTRKKATLVIAGVIFLVGVPASLSIGPWSGFHILPNMGIFDTLDFISGKVLLPLGGMLLAIFLGWVWGMENAIKEATNDGKLNFALAGVWTILIKYIAPVAIAVVFVQGIISTFF